MTLPYEQYNAVENTRRAMVDLAWGRREITAEDARRFLRHFPTESETCDLIRKVHGDDALLDAQRRTEP